jgi:hypothetical protein
MHLRPHFVLAAQDGSPAVKRERKERELFRWWTARWSPPDRQSTLPLRHMEKTYSVSEEVTQFQLSFL